jgi:predicted dehydrogenase
VDVRFAGLLRCADGVLAHFDCGLDLARRQELEVIGDRASLVVREPFSAVNVGIEIRDEDGVEHVEVEAADSYCLQVANFSAAVRGHGEPLLGGTDAVAQARVIEALYTAADSGRSVSL